MYIIKQFGRRFGKKTFFTYEDARSYVRKYIRKHMNHNRVFPSMWDYSDVFYNNPSTSKHGFKIEYSNRAGPRFPF